MNIIYFGNKLIKHRKMRSALETMIPHFSDFAQVCSYSDKAGHISKARDMISGFLKTKQWADLVIIDVFSTKAFYFSLVLGFLSSFFCKPFILVLRGGNLPERFQRRPLTIKWLFGRANAIVAPSPYLQNFFEREGFTIEHIPNIIDISQYKFMLRESLEPSILYLRGFGQVYNPLMLVYAVHIIREIPRLKVLMLGSRYEQHYKDVIETIERLNLGDIIKVEEKKTRDEWVELSRKYSFMISCPDVDNTPTSLIEGMALGMCVVTTRVGGVPFLVNDNEVFFVEKNDHKELGNILAHLINDAEQYKEKAIQARLKAEGFTWAEVKPKWQEIFVGVLENRS